MNCYNLLCELLQLDVWTVTTCWRFTISYCALAQAIIYCKSDKQLAISQYLENHIYNWVILFIFCQFLSRNLVLFIRRIRSLSVHVQQRTFVKTIFLNIFHTNIYRLITVIWTNVYMHINSKKGCVFAYCWQDNKWNQCH